MSTCLLGRGAGGRELVRQAVVRNLGVVLGLRTVRLAALALLILALPGQTSSALVPGGGSNASAESLVAPDRELLASPGFEEIDVPGPGFEGPLKTEIEVGPVGLPVFSDSFEYAIEPNCRFGEWRPKGLSSKLRCESAPDARDGSASLKVSSLATSRTIIRTLPVTPDKSYAVTTWARGRVDSLVANDQGAVWAWSTSTRAQRSSGQWYRLTTVIRPQSTNLQLAVAVRSGEAYVDAFTVDELSAGTYQAQAFAPHRAKLPAVDLKLSKAGNPGDLRVEIWRGLDNHPFGSIISTTVPAARIGATADWVRVSLPFGTDSDNNEEEYLWPRTPYFVVVRQEPGGSGSYRWQAGPRTTWRSHQRLGQGWAQSGSAAAFRPWYETNGIAGAWAMSNGFRSRSLTGVLDQVGPFEGSDSQRIERPKLPSGYVYGLYQEVNATALAGREITYSLASRGGVCLRLFGSPEEAGTPRDHRSAQLLVEGCRYGGQWKTTQGSVTVPSGVRSVTFWIEPQAATTWVDTASLKVGQLPSGPEQFGRPPWAPTFQDPVNTATGNFVYQAEDLFVPARPVPLAFTRVYNSQDTAARALGPGWAHNFDVRLIASADQATIVREDGRWQSFRLVEEEYLPPPGEPADLTGDPQSGWHLTERGGATLVFSPSGRLESIVDRSGNTLSLTYDGAGRLSEVVDGADRALAFSHDEQGSLSGVIGPGGVEVSFGYDGAGRLSWSKDALGHRTSYEYGAEDLLVSVTDPLGHRQVINRYDSLRRVVEQVNAVGEIAVFGYGQGRTAIETLTGITIDEFDEYGRLVEREKSSERSIGFEYDARGNLAGVRDARGAWSRMTYDAQDNLVEMVDRAGQTAAYSYDDADRLTAHRDGSGKTMLFDYDERGNLTRITDPLDVTSRLGYDAAGNLVEIADATGRVRKLRYDDVGNLAGLEEAPGEWTDLAYDDAGRLIAVTDPEGFRSRFEYDRANHLVRATDPVGAQTRYSYDDAGRLAQVENPGGAITRYWWDHAGRLTGVEDPAGHRANYEYNEYWRIASVTAGVARSEFFYDRDGRPTQTVDPTGREWSAGYDGNGNLAWARDPAGSTIRHAYDAEDRLVRTEHPDGSEVQYRRDALGRLVEMLDAVGQTRFAYDALGRLTRFEDALGVVSEYGYDAAGRRASVRYPSGKEVRYQYDAAGRLSKVTDWLGRLTRYDYDSRGLVSAVKRPDGFDSRFAYDAVGRLTELRHWASKKKKTKELLAQKIGYDLPGRRTSVFERVKGRERLLSYEYDAAGRLVAAHERAGSCKKPACETHSTFRYDPNGNLVGQTGERPRFTASYEHDQAGRLVSWRRGEHQGVLSYDAAGNPKREVIRDEDSLEEALEYRFDGAGRLVRVERGDPEERLRVDFLYDGLGTRLSRTAWEEEGEEIEERSQVRYATDITDPVSEVLEVSGDREQAFLYGLGRLAVATSEKEALGQYVTDGLGSVRGVASEGGGLHQRNRFDPWGVPAPGSHLRGTGKYANTYGFTGEDWDQELGLLYLRARYYRPEAGRFLTADSFPGFPMDPLSQNVWAYAADSPTNYIDPTGHIVWLGAVFAVGGMVGGVANAVNHHYNAPPGKRNWVDYVEAFGVGGGAGGAAALTGVGLAPFSGVGSFLLAGGAVSVVGQGTANILSGRPFFESLPAAIAFGAVGAPIGRAVTTSIPALRNVGFAPKVSLLRGYGSPLGGNAGPNSKRYLQRQLAGGILGRSVGYSLRSSVFYLATK